MSDTPTPATPFDPSSVFFRRRWAFVVVAIIAAAGWVLNVVGISGFPSNAPVEMLINVILNISLATVAIVSFIGALRAWRPVAKPGGAPLWVGVGFVALVLAAWSIGGITTFWALAVGGSPRYDVGTGAVALLSQVWAAGILMALYSTRQDDDRRRTWGLIGAIVLWAIPVAGVAASALLYGAGLTD